MSTSSNPKPRFSVVAPAYNAEQTLQETLDGVLSQQFDDWECVVVDDGSTDSTPEIVRSAGLKDARVRLVQQQNKGTAGAYSTAVAASKADLIVICAADDFLLPQHLRVMSELIDANPDYEIYSSNGEFLYHETGLRRPVYASSEWDAEHSLSFEEVASSCFYSVGVVIRRSAYERADGHRAGVYTDDYDLWLRAMARGARHIYTPEILSVHRVSDFQQSANLNRLYESNLEVYAHLLETEPLSRRQVDAVKSSIIATREFLDGVQVPVHAEMEMQAQRLHAAVEKVVGPSMVDGVMRVIHSVSWISRPLRRAVAAARHRKSGL